MYHYLKYWAKFSDKCVFMHPTVCCRSPAGGEAGNNRRLSVATGISKHFLVASTDYSPRALLTSLQGSICSFAAGRGKTHILPIKFPSKSSSAFAASHIWSIGRKQLFAVDLFGNKCLWWVGRGWTIAELDPIIQPFNLHKPGQASESHTCT